jgi:putative hemin transport protein
MALTRNHAVVHERKGCYKDVSATGPMGLAIGDDIDLRLFFSQWRHGYALVETDGATIKRSLQFFDAAGEAVHKIFLQPESDVDEFDMLVEQFRAANQTAGERVLSKPPCVAVAPDSEIDVDGMRAAWDRMRDTHEFFGLLKKYGVARTQALRLADPEYVTRVATSATKQMLEHAAASGAAIMCFVGNHGCIQIHTGPVANIKVMGPWLNVLDPDFNLHLREDLVHELWIVKKPTSEGIVTSLEVFDRDGLQIAQFFGKRKPGLPEREDWREIVEHLPRLDSVAYVVPTGASIDEKQVAA